MTHGVIYLRVSGESQVLGDGFPRQREACQKYAQAHDIEIVREFLDEGVTGKMELEGRAGLSACIQFVREHEVGLVLCESSDRLARDMIVAEVVVREFQKIGVRIIAAGSGVDLTEGDDSNPTAKLIRQILAAVAEFDRCVTVLKLKGARDRIRASGIKCDGKKAIGEKPGEEDTLCEILLQHDVGKNSAQIAQLLNLRNIPSRSGKPWRSTVIAKILARERAKRSTRLNPAA